MTGGASKRKSSASTASGAKKAKTTSKEELLGIITQLSSLHKGAAPLNKVSRRAGYGDASNPSFRKALKRASNQDLLVVEGDTVKVTGKGQEMAGDAPDCAFTNALAQSKIKETLSPKMIIAFDYVVGQHPNPAARCALASELGYTSDGDGAFKKLLTRMRALDAIEFVDKDEVKLSATALPEEA